MKRVLIALSLLFALFGAPTYAQTVELADESCAAGAATQAAALSLATTALDCGPDRFRQTAPFVRVHTDLSADFVPRGRLYWQTDPSAFDSMILRLSWSDGSESVIDVDPGMAVRNWASTARFSVPLPEVTNGVTLAAIDMVVENPRMIATMRDAILATPRTAARVHFDRSLWTLLAIGMLVAPIFYTTYFYRVMRAPFMLWHAAMCGGMALFVACNSGVIFWAVPSLTLFERWQLNSATIAFAVAAAVFFTIGTLENGVLGRFWRHALVAALLPIALAKLLGLFAALETRTTAGWYFALSFLPLLIVLPSALVSALRRGSRSSLYALIGFGVLALSGIMMMIDGTGIVDLGLFPEDAMLATMVFMTMITAAGVGDRFMVMRMKLDRERRRAAQLGELAFSDPLTGLANRRAFDARGILEAGQALVVADIDHFKSINDRFGHSGGDAALQQFAALLRSCLETRPGVAIYRLGGEEFGMVLPVSDNDTLAEQCERIREAIEAGREGVDAAPPMTVSIGAVLGRDNSIAEAFAEADNALYRAKAQGRNRFCIAGDTTGHEDQSAPEGGEVVFLRR